MKKILVYGYYYKGNLGDNLFIDSFREIFKEYNFTFTNFLTKKNLEEHDCLWIGGGSLLGNFMDGEKNIDEIIFKKDIFYIGISAETIHNQHLQLISKAKLVAMRSEHNFDTIKKLNNNTYIIKDLVYCFYDRYNLKEKINNKILVIPNIEVVPKQSSEFWKHSSWVYFKSEFCQFLNHLDSMKIEIDFSSFCENSKQSDTAAAHELINFLNIRNYQNIKNFSKSNLQEVIQELQKYDIIYTQRFHGAILSDIAKVPFVSIAHHDKLKNTQWSVIDYYGIKKSDLLKSFQNKNIYLIKEKSNDFSELKSIVAEAFQEND